MKVTTVLDVELNNRVTHRNIAGDIDTTPASERESHDVDLVVQNPRTGWITGYLSCLPCYIQEARYLRVVTVGSLSQEYSVFSHFKFRNDTFEKLGTFQYFLVYNMNEFIVAHLLRQIMRCESHTCPGIILKMYVLCKTYQ